MTSYEKELLETLEKSFSKGEYHYAFDIPENAEEFEKLYSALRTLENESRIIILHSPELSGDDYVEVEKLP